jgi:hypothetical protein
VPTGPTRVRSRFPMLVSPLAVIEPSDPTPTPSAVVYACPRGHRIVARVPAGELGPISCKCPDHDCLAAEVGAPPFTTLHWNLHPAKPIGVLWIEPTGGESSTRTAAR